MKSKKLPIPLIVVAVVLVLGIVGLIVYTVNQGSGNKTANNSNQSQSSGSSSGSSATPTAGAKQTNSVEISNFQFTPATITVKAGTKVTWTNKDSVQHNVVGDNFKNLRGPLLDQGKTFSFTFDKVGTYPYHCNPHPYMKGTVIVTG